MSEKYDVFLSFHPNEKDIIESIATRLTDEANLNPFFHDWHLVPGEPWQEAVEEALGNSETFAVFICDLLSLRGWLDSYYEIDTSNAKEIRRFATSASTCARLQATISVWVGFVAARSDLLLKRWFDIIINPRCQQFALPRSHP